MTTIKSKADLGLIAHLLRRAGFGATPQEMDRFSEMDYDEIVDHLLNFEEAEHNPDWIEELDKVHTPESEEYGINSFVYQTKLRLLFFRLATLL